MIDFFKVVCIARLEMCIARKAPSFGIPFI